MDIAAMSTALHQSSLPAAVGIAVLGKANDEAKQEGQMLVQMMQQSVHPNLGQSLDIRI